MPEQDTLERIAQMIPKNRHEDAITDNLRSAVFSAWGNRCAYCRVRDAEHVDHIYPRAKGGPNVIENYAAACQTCNLMKTDMVLGEGLLEIIFNKAKTKAPTIRKAIAPKPKTKAAEKQPALISAVVDAYCDLQAHTGEDTRPRAEIEPRFIWLHEHNSPTVIRRAAAEYRGELRRLLRAEKEAREKQALMDQIHDAFSATGICKTAVTLCINQAEVAGQLETIAGMKRVLRSALSRRPKASVNFIDLGMNKSVRAELRDLLLTGSKRDEHGREVIPFSSATHPNFIEFIRGGIRPYGVVAHVSMNLLTGYSFSQDTGDMKLAMPTSPDILRQALDRCDELDAEAFDFRNPLVLDRIPPANFCTPRPSFRSKYKTISIGDL
jgi:hypothetical protein